VVDVDGDEHLELGVPVAGEAAHAGVAEEGAAAGDVVELAGVGAAHPVVALPFR
jgi:hypothetical protein